MFIEKPSKYKARTAKKLVHGHGINDAEYVTAYKDADGTRHTCPYFTTWYGLLERVFCEKFKLRRPSYKGCTVEPSWLTFSAFRKWMEQQAWQGMTLDKDLLVLGNKHYGPATCMFVTREINAMTVLRQNDRGEYPLGVSKCTVNGYSYFTAACSFYSKQKRLGYFKTPEEAEAVYKTAKRDYLLQVANAQSDIKLQNALINFANSF